MGRRDGLDAEPLDQLIKAIAISVHVSELGPEQGQVREHRRHVGRTERTPSSAAKPPWAASGIVLVGKAAPRNRPPPARAKPPPGGRRAAETRPTPHHRAAPHA